MALGRAEERLRARQDAHELVAGAHESTKEALRELRELVRGIHPPALDLGLGPALETLAARAALPVALDVTLAARPSQGVETIAYFCVAELLANAARHASATQCAVVVRGDARTLRVLVRDNGHGGAVIGAGSGLPGLAARAATVDGELRVQSPPGGPTEIAIELPLEGVR